MILTNPDTDEERKMDILGAREDIRGTNTLKLCPKKSIAILDK